jgi:hypothetical protein
METINENWEKIRIASFFDANRTYPILFQHLGYRKAIAERLLRCTDDIEKRSLFELFIKVNEEIKLIIGI